MRISKGRIGSILMIAALALCACGSENITSYTIMESQFGTSVPTDSSDEKIIYINEDMDRLLLKARLKIDCGSATIQVIDLANDAVIWSEDFTEDSNFDMELVGLKAQSEYFLNVQSVQSKDVYLTVTSDEKLVKNKEKPERE